MRRGVAAAAAGADVAAAAAPRHAAAAPRAPARVGRRARRPQPVRQQQQRSFSPGGIEYDQSFWPSYHNRWGSHEMHKTWVGGKVVNPDETHSKNQLVGTSREHPKNNQGDTMATLIVKDFGKQTRSPAAPPMPPIDPVGTVASMPPSKGPPPKPGPGAAGAGGWMAIKSGDWALESQRKLAGGEEQKLMGVHEDGTGGIDILKGAQGMTDIALEFHEKRKAHTHGFGLDKDGMPGSDPWPKDALDDKKEEPDLSWLTTDMEGSVNQKPDWVPRNLTNEEWREPGQGTGSTSSPLGLRGMPMTHTEQKRLQNLSRPDRRETLEKQKARIDAEASEFSENSTFRAGNSVTVGVDLTSDDEAPVQLKKDMTGCIERIDDDGDLIIRFDGIGKNVRVAASNLGSLIPEDILLERDDALKRSDEELADAITDIADMLTVQDEHYVTFAGLYRHSEDPPYIHALTEDNYPELVEQEELPIIIDAWSPTCADSMAMSATLKMLVNRANSDGQTRIKLLTMHVGKNHNLALHLGVHSLPTALAVRECRVLEHQAGLVDEEHMAQFVFGFVNAMYGDSELDFLSESEPVCMLIDGRVALKAGDYNTAWDKYWTVYELAYEDMKKEKAMREELKKQEVFMPQVTRPISEAEVLAVKAVGGLITICYNRQQFRHARKLMMHIEQDHMKAYSTMSDIVKIIATVDILISTGYKQTDNIDDIEDEERVDQHNLDIKLRLVGAYFMGGEYIKAMSKVVAMVRKNFMFRDEIAIHVCRRIFRYLGRNHPAVHMYQSALNSAIEKKWDSRPMTRINQRLSKALNEPAMMGVLEHEIPKMVDISKFRVKGQDREGSLGLQATHGPGFAQYRHRLMR